MKIILLFVFILACDNLFPQNNVGIGTINPAATLDVLRGTAADGTAAFRGTTNISHFNVGVTEHTYIRGGKPGSHVILNDVFGSGNIGIGTALPQVKLDITGADGWNLVNGEGDFRLGNSTYRLKMGVALTGSGAGAVGLMQYGAATGYNALSLGSQGQYLLRLYGNNKVVELANVADGRVGIGTASPLATLDVIRGTASEGTVLFRGTTNNSHFNYSTTENTYIRGGKAGSHVIINDVGSGLVGIGTEFPFAPLTFNNYGGQKISLYGTSNNNYGFGITSGTLQIHSDAVGSDIAFGYGNSSSFSETMRIKGNGNVGIGVNPAYILDVKGRMRIRSGGDNSSTAGLWLNNSMNAETAFIGMANDTHVGFYGTGAGFKFTMNTQTGALQINGSEGQVNQVLVSGGSGGSSSWTTAGSLIKTYLAVGEVGELGINVTSTSEWVDVPINHPSNTITIIVPIKSRLIISAHFRTWGPNCPVGCPSGGAEITVQIDDIVVNYGSYYRGITTMTAAANELGSANISNFMYDVAAGTHTVKFKVKRSPHQSINNLENFSCSQASVMVLPVD